MKFLVYEFVKREKICVFMEIYNRKYYTEKN